MPACAVAATAQKALQDWLLRERAAGPRIFRSAGWR